MRARYILQTMKFNTSKIPAEIGSGELVMVRTEHEGKVHEKVHVVCNGELVPLVPEVGTLREQAAIAAMQGMLATQEPVDKKDEYDLALYSVRCADALIAELKKEVAK